MRQSIVNFWSAVAFCISLFSLQSSALSQQPSATVPPAQSKTAMDSRGSQFIGFTDFSTFQSSLGERAGETVLTSPEINSAIHADEVVVSWNVEMPSNAWIKVEARALYPDPSTKYYTMGLWSSDPKQHPRESLPGQQDDDGTVSTDTLVLKRACDRLQIRLTLSGDDHAKSKLKLLGLSLIDTTITPPALPPNKAAWDKTLPVPERSQMLYPGGNVWCSPTTLSMLLAYWSQKLNRPELDREVPEVAKEIYDVRWQGTGNWAFNVAYAGAYPGMRACVTRLSDVSELEDWVAAGLPVGVSLSYDLLRGRVDTRLSGHLVVCVGFTKEGDVVINDPGTTKNVRKIFPRKNLTSAWADSRNTVYLVYPESAKLPPDRFGHWELKRSFSEKPNFSKKSF
jgi:hypothetical protein